MMVKELIEALKACNPEAIIIMDGSDTHGGKYYEPKIHKCSAPERFNTMSGWGPDITSKAVEIVQGDEMVIMEPNE